MVSLSAMPEDRLLQTAGATVVEVKLVPIDRISETDAPQRTSLPLMTVGQVVGTLIRQILTHVVQQHIGVAVDGLTGECRHIGLTGVHRGDVALGAADLVEELVPLLHHRAIESPRRRDGERPAVEDHRIQHVVRHLVGGRIAVALPIPVLLHGVEAVGEAHVVDEGLAGLLHDGGSIGLPAKATDAHLFILIIPDIIGLAGDAVIVLIVRVGMREDLLLGDRLQKSQPEGRHADTGREHVVGRQRDAGV